MSRRRKARRSARSTTTRSCSTAQPIALVLAEDWETARFAASLVRVEYDKEAHRHRPARAARPGLRRREAARSRAATPPRHLPRRTCATRPNISSRPSITTRWSCLPRPRSGTAAASSRSMTRRRACRTCSAICAACSARSRTTCACMSPYMGGGFGAGLRPQYQVVLAVLGALALRALGAARADAPADVRARLPAGDDRAARARRQGRRNARRHHPRGDRRHLAIRGLLAQRHRLGGPALQSPPTRNSCTSSRGSTCRRPADMRAPGAATGVYALESAMDELAVALEARSGGAAAALLFGSRPEREPALHQQAAARMLPPGRRGVRLEQAQSGAALDARRQRAGRLGHGDRRLGGVADAGRRPHRADRQRPRGGVLRGLRHRHRHLHRSWRRWPPTALGLPIENISVKLGDFSLPQAPVEGGSWMAASASHAVVPTADEVRNELLTLAKTIDGFAARRRQARGRRARRTARSSASMTRAARSSIADADAARRRRPDREGESQQLPGRPFARAQHAFGDLRRGEGRRAARRHPRHARRQRGRGRAHSQHQDRAQPDHGQRGVGHRHGAARGDAVRPPLRPHHERQHRRVSRAGECRRARHQGDLRR